MIAKRGLGIKGATFRRLLPTDRSALLELQRACYPVDLWDDDAALDGLDGVVAEVDGRVVSVALGRARGDVYELYSVETLPEHRRRGLAEQCARTLLCQRPAVEALAVTVDGRRLCERLGLWATGESGADVCGHPAEILRGSVPWP